MAITKAFAELDQTLPSLLAALPDFSVRLSRSTKLRGACAIMPTVLVCPGLQFNWRCQSVSEGNDTRFIFWDFTSSAREMLDARLFLAVQPRPVDVPPFPGIVDVRTVPVRLPTVIKLDLPAAEFQRIAPAGAKPQRTIVLNLNAGDTLAIWTGPDGPDKEINPEHLRARWIRTGEIIDCGPKSRSNNDPDTVNESEDWPVELFVAIAQVLAAAGTTDNSAGWNFGDLPSSPQIWKLASNAIDTIQSIAADFEDAKPTAISKGFEGSDDYGWRVVDLNLEIGALVNAPDSDKPLGQLAEPEDGDTFLTPFQIGWDAAKTRLPLNLTLQPPDLVGDGQLQQALIHALANDGKLFDYIEGQAQRQVTKTQASQLRSWLKSNLDRGICLRVGRTKKIDQYLYVAHGVAANTDCAFMVFIDDVQTRYVSGELQLTDYTAYAGYVGPVAGVSLPWKDHWWWWSDPQSLALCQALATLLQWRLLLP